MALKDNKTVLLGLLLTSGVLLIFYQLSVNTGRLSQCQTVQEHSHLSRNNQHGRWIITHGISSLKEGNLAEWTILVYGQPHSKNQNCIQPNCRFLQEELQKGVQFEYSQGLSLDVLAYMYAMSNGASYIFVVQDWHFGLKELLDRFRYEEFASGIVAKTNKTLIDPFTIFSEGKSFKINASLTDSPYYTSYDYVLREDIHPLIQTCVPQNIKALLLKGNREQPQVFIPSGTFISFDFNQTLFHQNAFWALGLSNVPFGSILAQKLLWEIEGNFGTSPKRGSQQIPGGILHPEYLFENPDFMKLMKNSYCKNTLDFLECFTYLTNLLKEKRFITEVDHQVLVTWHHVLKNIGYQPPRRSKKREQKLDPNDKISGIFSPSRKVPTSNVALRYLRNICPNAVLPKPTEFINDIALIISFNTASLYSNIPFLEIMYRQYFRHIIFCGPQLDKFRPFAFNSTIGDFIYIEGFKQGWYYMFECTMAAMKMNLNVKGFVQIGDDTLLNPWVINKFPKEKIWLHKGIRYANTSLEELKPIWIWWKGGKNNLNKMLKEIKEMSKLDLESEFETRFIETFRNSSKEFTRYYIHGCDFMYVPMRVKQDFIKAGNLLIKHDVMLEIGFANIALGIENWENIHFVEDGSLWYNRARNKEIYRKDRPFVHPFKLRNELKETNKKGREFFCEYIKGDVKNIH